MPFNPTRESRHSGPSAFACFRSSIDACPEELGAGGGIRTLTARTGQGILSPQCLPFHHPGGRNTRLRRSAEAGKTRFVSVSMHDIRVTQDPMSRCFQTIGTEDIFNGANEASAGSWFLLFGNPFLFCKVALGRALKPLRPASG